ncbi:MAG TPA: MBL fold metallo-hydrolase [Solirubrobacteraceae bacterium]|nr:MBL fold metallo-hydrolase [Solirubrobacteraceae bacterium]
MEELAGGLWRWTARHPEWHPGQWGSEVASYAVDAGDVMLLIDPLVDAPEQLDGIVAKDVAILITIPYHVRSAEPLSERYDATIYGHKAVADRLTSARRFAPIDGELPGGARAYTIGKPRRYEMPIHLPSHKALATGDALVTTLAGDLRLWHWREPVDEQRTRWYRETFNPTLQPLLELDLERILVTHGPPILSYGSAALQAAVDAEPWYSAG